MKKHIRFAAMLFCVTLSLGNVAQAQKAANSAGGHKYVDLGLPSGTLWATCNIGASKPEDYGNYYAWGEISTKSDYAWNSYKYTNGTTWMDPKLTKYCSQSECNGSSRFTDNLTELQSGDDPAAYNWANGWLTPSKAQWDELLANTTNKWTTRNGVKGRLFTSKKNGKTLFLPSAGGYEDDSSKLDRIGGSNGIYWSCSLYTDCPIYAWYIGFTSDDCRIYCGDRNWGISVRPVRQK